MTLKYPRDVILRTGDAFRIHQCEACEGAFTHPVPLDLSKYYPTKYRAYKPIVVKVLTSLYRMKIRQLAESFVQPGDVLEIGCGPGIMLQALRELGWRTTGLERSEEVCDYARKEFGLNIIAGEIGDLPPGTQYDLIVLFQVLEHLANPVAVIQECYARLRPGGQIVVAVPNFESWQSHFGGTGWMHLDVPRHLFHYSQRSLSSLLQRTGFAVVSTDYVSLEHDPIGWIQSTLNRLVSPRNSLLRYLMGLESRPASVALSLVLALLFALPSIALSAASWVAGEGAIISVRAIREPQA